MARAGERRWVRQLFRLRPFDLGLLAWMLGVPLARVPGWGVEQAQGVAFCAGAVVLACVAACCRPRRELDARPLAWLAGWAVASAVVLHRPEQVARSFEVGYFHLFVLLSGALYVACGCLAAFLAARWASDGCVPWAIAIGAAGGLLVRNPGILLTSGQSALLAAMGIAVVLGGKPRGWRRAEAAGLTWLWLWQLRALGSWSALFGLLLGLCAALAGEGGRRAALVGMGVCMGVALANAADLRRNLESRLETWPATAREWLERPLVGLGPETGLLSPMVRTRAGMAHRHSDLLAGLRDYGLAGMLPVGWLFGMAWHGAGFRRRWWLAAVGMTMLAQTQACFPRLMSLACAGLGWCLQGERCSA